jgi:beta-glucosidase
VNRGSAADGPFPPGFLWGAATSAYQVEGAVGEGGRGTSIWDTFCRTPGAVRGGDTGEIACDQYHRYGGDIALMADLGIAAYRFSIAWPRIQPDGRGPVNQRGLDHYRRLVGVLHAHGITPMVTLYHWDLPQALDDLDGWTSRDTAERFAEYASAVHEALRGDVALWVTVNEPWVTAWLGYGSGVHAPGRRDDGAALAASHHLLLAHALAQEATGQPMGIALNLEPHRPASADPEDLRVSRLADLHRNALFLDPLFGRGYPGELIDQYRGTTDWSFVRDGDLDAIAVPPGFLGVNYYRPQTVAAHSDPGHLATELAGSLGARSVIPRGAETTAMGWPIDPSGLTEILVRLTRDYAPARLLVTENGAAFDDALTADGTVEDHGRVEYLRSHIEAARVAIDAGVPLEGFFVWSLLDNFEWAEGYSKRFGLVHVDFETQVRTPKASARWYAAHLAERRRFGRCVEGQ